MLDKLPWKIIWYLVFFLETPECYHSLSLTCKHISYATQWKIVQIQVASKWLKYIYAPGVKISSFYPNGSHEGLYKKWNHAHMETMGWFVLGKKEGLWIWFHPGTNITRCRGRYKNDKCIGEWEMFDIRSRITCKVIYNDKHQIQYKKKFIYRT